MSAVIGVWLALLAALACIAVAAYAWWRSQHEEVVVCKVCGLVRRTRLAGGRAVQRRYVYPDPRDSMIECWFAKAHQWKRRWKRI